MIYGTSRDETLINETGDTVLVAGAGNDRIWAGAGNDILDGGVGNDELQGETGNDTYIFRRDAGQDVIIDTDPTAGNMDTIFMGGDLTSEDIRLRRVGNDLVVRISETTDKVTVKDHFKNESPLNRIEKIRFQDGTEWGIDDIAYRVTLPSETDDTLYGTLESDTLRGYGGDDQLYGQAGDDLLEGGSGVDTLAGADGSDTLDGGSGDDILMEGRVMICMCLEGEAVGILFTTRIRHPKISMPSFLERTLPLLT